MGRKITRFHAQRLHLQCNFNAKIRQGEAMAEQYGVDAFSPQQIAERVDNIGVAKARLPLLSMAMLGVLAGAFIGLGALYYTLDR